jgi:hypothetical protein
LPPVVPVLADRFLKELVKEKERLAAGSAGRSRDDDESL